MPGIADLEKDPNQAKTPENKIQSERTGTVAVPRDIVPDRFHAGIPIGGRHCRGHGGGPVYGLEKVDISHADLWQAYRLRRWHGIRRQSIE